MNEGEEDIEPLIRTDGKAIWRGRVDAEKNEWKAITGLSELLGLGVTETDVRGNIRPLEGNNVVEKQVR